MKIYKREIKPYIQPFCLQGCNSSPYSVDGYDWVSENLERQLRKEIIVEDSWSKLIFKERYVVVGDGEDEINLALEALEKQIPKKPIENRYPWCICPNCRGSVYVEHIQEHIQNGEQTYCEHCGQAIDWSVTNENY